jgi:hypothetical protein
MVETKVAVRMVWGILDQNQMSEIDGVVFQAAKREIRANIAIDHQKGIIAEQGQRFQDAATGFKRLGLTGITDESPKGLAITQRRTDLMAKVGRVDDDVRNTTGYEVSNQVNDEWLPPSRQQGLGGMVG